MNIFLHPLSFTKTEFSARQGFAPSVQGAPATVAGVLRTIKGVTYMTERPPPSF